MANKRRQQNKQYQFNEYDENPIKSQRKKHRKGRVRKRVKVLIFLLFLGVCAYYFNNDISNVAVIKISGNNLLDEERIRELMDIDETDKHLLTIPMFIEKKLKEEPLIKSVDVTKGLINTVYVSIEEKEVIAYLNEEGTLAVIDMDGNVSYLTNNDTLSDIQNNPRIKGFVGQEEMLAEFAKNFSELDESVRILISDIRFQPEGVYYKRLRIDMRDGAIVYIEIDNLERLKLYSKNAANYTGKCVFSIEGKHSYAQPNHAESKDCNEIRNNATSGGSD